MLTFRSQLDLVTDPQLGPVVDCSGDPMITRQEERDKADVNRVVAAYQSSGRLPDMRLPVSGDVDFDMDLLGAYQARHAVQQAWLDLPVHLRERYASPEALLTAAAQMQLDLSEPVSAPVVPPES